MTSINFNSNVFQTRQNPDEYAKTYAEQNGITLAEAKEELKAKYGDPKQNADNASIFNTTSEDSYYEPSFDMSFDADYSEGKSLENLTGGLDIKELFQKFMDMLRGGNGPQNEGDPQHHLNPETGEMTGPQKEGDYNPIDIQQKWQELN